MTSALGIDTTKQDAYNRGEDQGVADALAGRPSTSPPRDGRSGEQDYYADGYDFGYQQGLKMRRPGEGNGGQPVVDPMQPMGQTTPPVGQTTTTGVDAQLRVDQAVTPSIDLDDPKPAGLAVLITSGGVPVRPGRVELRIAAPTGMVFDDYMTPSYLYSPTPVSEAERPTHRLEEGGRVMVITGDFHVRTNEADQHGWLISASVRHMNGAKPGKNKDGLVTMNGVTKCALGGNLF
ncbi:hypothetical protein [Streptomyces caeruleatus]|uniref:Uncharacterized protein n=1 Tax=Streptomyces caeruleatus TaxID=661399 RepID=A0A101TX02_9ACTN|nr:hypothetical protein [Streptomyces caeruleatus]KUO00030.1 hypothetical protein AQJ67_24490 [Streptomyces caeruleatus]